MLLPGNSLPVLGLLDMHGVPRGDVYRGLLQKLRENLLLRIDTMDQVKHLFGRSVSIHGRRRI